MPLYPHSLHSSADPVVHIPLLRGQHQGTSDTSGSGQGDGEGEGGEEAQWARRQYSVLWSPMPASYEESSAGAGSGSGDAGRGMGAWGTTPYRMSSVEEAEEERSSPFFTPL